MKWAFICLALQGLQLHAGSAITNIAGGGEYSLILRSDGSLWAMGWNLYGQLGDGTYGDSYKPKQVVSTGVVAVAAGGAHSLFIKSDRSLWGTGLNYNRQLGDGTSNNTTNRPEQLVSSSVTAVAAGGTHSLFLMSDGSLWAMGNNLYGQLGNGRFTTNFPYFETNRPQQIISSGVTAIAAGTAHSLFLKSDGSLWGMGNNQFGQLGDGTTNNVNKPEEISLGSVTAIAAGGYNSLFLTSDGSLWATGWNYYGQLGNGAGGTPESFSNTPQQIVSNGVVAFAAGYGHTLYLKSDGSLWALGKNEFGQLGIGTLASTNRPQRIVPCGVVTVAAGGNTSLFLKDDGSLWAMGYGDHGQLGDGFSSNSLLPEQILPSPPPELKITIAGETNLQFQTTCHVGGNFYLLASTNLMLPLAQWRSVSTNLITRRGANNFGLTFTNALNSPARQRFYIMQSE